MFSSVHLPRDGPAGSLTGAATAQPARQAGRAVKRQSPRHAPALQGDHICTGNKFPAHVTHMDSLPPRRRGCQRWKRSSCRAGLPLYIEPPCCPVSLLSEAQQSAGGVMGMRPRPPALHESSRRFFGPGRRAAYRCRRLCRPAVARCRSWCR